MDTLRAALDVEVNRARKLLEALRREGASLETVGELAALLVIVQELGALVEVEPEALRDAARAG